MVVLEHRGPSLLRIGFVTASGIDASRRVDRLELGLSTLLERRALGLSADEDLWRQSVRDILRNGSYKPTGRGKPASEYLLRAASEGTFPKINAPVDACNYISLSSLLPVSIWDLDRAGADRFLVRLGLEGESYVFNEAGQTIDLRDLVVGCVVDNPEGSGRSIVNPVKDSMATKTSPTTTRVAALIYSRPDEGPHGSLAHYCQQFADILSLCGDSASADYAIVGPGEETRIPLP